MFFELDFRAKRRISQNEIEPVIFKTVIFSDEANFIHTLQSINADYIRMSIVMDNHIHLCHTSNHLRNFHAIQIMFSEFVPIITMLMAVPYEITFMHHAVGFIANFIEGIKQKSTTAACHI